MNDKIINPRILHIDVERGWRGGQQQAYYLFMSEINRNINSSFACLKSSKLESQLYASKVPHISVNFKNELDFISAKKVAGYAKKHQINIIVCHSSHSLSLGLMAKMFYKSVKLIAVRRVDFKTSGNVLSRWKYNNSLLDKIVCISEKIKDVMSDRIDDNSKLITIRSGIDIQRFSVSDGNKVRKEFGIENKFLVGTVAAFVGHKDYFTFINTAKKILEKRDDVVFIAVGDGEKFEEIKALSRKFRIAEYIIFPGFRTDVGNFLKSFDVFLFTSEMEGLGTSILDAMSVGLPIVATTAGGIPEIVKANENGILCGIKKVQCLSEAVIKLLENIQLRREYGKKSLELVLNYDINKTADSYFRLYESLFKS